MYCRQCGYNNDQYSKLCHRCGSVLREAEEHYDNNPKEEQSAQEEGVLKYARKGDDLITLLKMPFRQLERVTENHRRRWPILIITASVIVICLVVWLTVLGTNACREEEAIIYGNTPSNTAFNALAAADDNYIYYTCPFGENPGLYRMSVSTGEILKISYHCLESLSVVDGWVYGMDTDGTVMRISYDGLSSQQVIEETRVKHPVVVGNYLYYIGKACRLCRADLTTLTKRSLAKTQPLTEAAVSEFVIYEDIIYFIEMSADDYDRLFTVSTEVTPPSYKDENGKTVQPESYTVSELVTPDGADIPNNPGCIRRMTPDGENESELLGSPVLNLTAGNGYLFFQTETTVVISATDIDPNAPADMPYELPAKKAWRLSLETLKYSTLLDAGIADSPMTPTDDGWVYYIAADGNLERVALKGGERVNVLTYKQDTDRFSLCAGRMYVMTDNETRLISMLPDGTGHIDLCEKLPEIGTDSVEE